jgi:PIN domain nuclease of toxin-antitoxin system
VTGLLDTHLLVWWLMDSRELPVRARELIEDSSNRLFVSSASFWELAIKVSRKKIRLDLSRLLPAVEDAGFEMLPIQPQHAIAVATLPWRHADPFDRLLIAQAQLEKIPLLTADGSLKEYGAFVVQV